MSSPKENDQRFVSFPLFHGTSSHHLARFMPGATPESWPHKDVALALFRDVWTVLRALGRKPEWWIENVLNQATSHANWQHGGLYITPSEQSAVRYAAQGAAYGGELLTFCKEAVEILFGIDEIRAEQIIQSAESIADYLKGGGTPILVQFIDVRESDLLPERSIDNVHEMITNLENCDEVVRPALMQQANFRLAPSCGTVARVFELDIEDANDPLTTFHACEIRT